MSTRPFKTILDENRQPVRVDLTDEEISDAAARTAAEQAEQQAKQTRADKQAAMLQWLEEQYDNRNNQTSRVP
jgi:hypothetical protein